MNIDERIEALTQSVELLRTLHRDLEVKTDQRMNQMTDAVTQLVRIVATHERRIDNLERGQ